MQSLIDKVFVDPLRLSPIIEQARGAGRIIVLANGCFELLHVGHVRYLAAARALGDLLIVAVNTDASIALIKQERRPVNPDLERFEIIAALESVDYVVPLADRTPAALVELFRPDIQAKGTDYSLDRIPERVVVERYGGRVELVGGPKCRSSGEMIRLMQIAAVPSPAAHGGRLKPLDCDSALLGEAQEILRHHAAEDVLAVPTEIPRGE